MDEWNQGYNDAREWCSKNYKPFMKHSMPDGFAHRGNDWSRGYAEGLMYGKNKIIDEAYPGNVGYSLDSNGKFTIYYPKGHPALNK